MTPRYRCHIELIKNEETGGSNCVVCGMCQRACPSGCITVAGEKPEGAKKKELTKYVRDFTKCSLCGSCVESCNFCVHRLDNGQTTTACQDACVKDGHQAIVFGDLRDPNSAVSKAMAEYPTVEIRADLKLNTGVRYTGL
mgnify:CR=1 FL=1